jgi:hypothetical protein
MLSIPASLKNVTRVPVGGASNHLKKSGSSLREPGSSRSADGVSGPAGWVETEPSGSGVIVGTEGRNVNGSLGPLGPLGAVSGVGQLAGLKMTRRERPGRAAVAASITAAHATAHAPSKRA